EVGGGRAELPASTYGFERISAEVTLDPEAGVPAFSPENDQVGVQREPTQRLVERLMDHLVGTDLWYREVEGGADHALTVVEDGGKARGFLLDFGNGRVRPLHERRETPAATPR